tara:strand:- start:944 stop:1315 length:372 start_codon:yes stop_codon:yes gene_type:complete
MIMKKVSFIIMLGIAVAAVAAVSPISWKTTSLDLGEVKAGVSKDLEFEFTNDGTEVITILDAKGSCGCTNVQYPKESIAPGETASITATFISKHAGTFKKNIKIKTSASEEYTYLYFNGEVVL